MHIAIIGSGNMANGIGSRVVAGGHSLTIYDRDVAKAQALATSLGGGSTSAPLSGAIEGDVVIFALPYNTIPEVITSHADSLAGKILVDISNPVNFETFELIPPAGSSGAEEIAKNLPKGATLVKAFNTTFAGTLVQGNVDGKKLDVYVASDNADAANTVVQLANDGGLRGLNVGPLSRARALEGFQLFHMALQQTLGTNWMSSIKILP